MSAAYRPLPRGEATRGVAEETVPYTPRTLRDRWRAYRGNPELLIGGAILLAFAAVALAVLAADRGTIPPMHFDAALLHGPLAPSRAHPLGILEILYQAPSAPAPAQYGVDELAALGQATPVDVGLFAAILLPSAAVGAVVGATAGASEGGTVDLVATAWGDVVVGVPPFLLVAILFVNLESLEGTGAALLLFAVVYLLILWPYYARTVRAQARIVATQPFVQAAEAAGASRWRILTRHILPNSLSPVLAQLPADLAGIFLLLTTFAFAGCKFPLFGTIAFTPSWTFPEWGYELGQGACNGLTVLVEANAWWMYAIPMTVVALFGVATALVCDGLQRQLERTRRAT